MDLGLKNKRVLITGGSKGIGKSIADAFYKEGSKLTIISRDERVLKKNVLKYGGQKKGHYYFNCDLNILNNPTIISNKIIDKLGPHEIIIHNVGGGLGVGNIFANLNDWKRVWNFNVGISIEMNNVLIKNLLKNKKKGKVVYVSSISSVNGDITLEGSSGKIPYAASKAFLNSYVRGMSRELSKKNILFNAVLPGAIITKGKYWDKIRKNKPKLLKEYIKKYYPIERFGKPEEIAPFVLFLCSKYSTFASGTLINIDGGKL